MASAFAHGVVALALARAGLRGALPWYFWLLAVISAILPDVDVLGFHAGIAYGDLWGHRGMTHSLLFAGLWSMVMVGVFFWGRNWRRQRVGLFIVFFVITVSHGLLDAMTNGGLGIAFFAPFDETRYFFSFRPLAVSPLGLRAFFDTRGLYILYNEMIWIGLPSLGLFVIGLWRRYQMTRRVNKRRHED